MRISPLARPSGLEPKSYGFGDRHVTNYTTFANTWEIFTPVAFSSLEHFASNREAFEKEKTRRQNRTFYKTIGIFTQQLTFNRYVHWRRSHHAVTERTGLVQPTEYNGASCYIRNQCLNFEQNTVTTT